MLIPFPVKPEPFPEIIFLSVGVVPPICVPSAPATQRIPIPPFGTAAAPEAFNPTMLPAIEFPVEPLILIPTPTLPEIKFPSHATAPPIVLLLAFASIWKPFPLFGTAAVPAALVPMKQRRTIQLSASMIMIP